MIIFLRKMRKIKYFSLGDRKGRPYAEVIDKRKLAVKVLRKFVEN